MIDSRTDSRTDTRLTFGDAFRLLQRAQKTRLGVPLYCLYVNRPAGRAVAALLTNTGVTPNQVTLLGAVLTYGSLLWLGAAAPTSAETAVVGIALALGFVLDSADGQLARLRGGGTRLGEWLDHCLDNGRITVMHLATLAFLLRSTDLPPHLLILVCGAFLLASSVIFFGGALVDQISRRSPPPGDPVPTAAPLDAPARRRALRRSVITLPVDYGITCLVFLTLPWPAVFLALYGLLAAVHVMFAAAYAAKWWSELGRSG